MKVYDARTKMIHRMLRLDEDKEEEDEHGSHGNTRLPYGLCKKYHIDLPNDATPRQAWQALKDKKGISAKEEYAQLKSKDKAIDVNEIKMSKDPANQYFVYCPYRIIGLNHERFESKEEESENFSDMVNHSYIDDNREEFCNKIRNKFKQIPNGMIAYLKVGWPHATYLKVGNDRFERIEDASYDGHGHYKSRHEFDGKRFYSASELSECLYDTIQNSCNKEPYVKKRFEECSWPAIGIRGIIDNSSSDYSITMYKSPFFISTTSDDDEEIVEAHQCIAWFEEWWRKKEEEDKRRAEEAEQKRKKETEARKKKVISRKESRKPGLLKSNFDNKPITAKEISDMCHKEFGCFLKLDNALDNGTINTLDDYKAVYDAIDTVFSVFGDIPVYFTSAKVLYYEGGEIDADAEWSKKWGKSIITLRGWSDTKSETGQVRKANEQRLDEYERAKQRVRSGHFTEQDKETAKYKRSVVGATSINPTMTTVMHELGHAVYDKYLNRLGSSIKEVFQEAIDSGDIGKYISHYSTTDQFEFFAEAFTAYLIGDPLPQYIIDMVELPIKLRDGEVKRKDLVWGCSTAKK